MLQAVSDRALHSYGEKQVIHTELGVLTHTASAEFPWLLNFPIVYPDKCKLQRISREFYAIDQHRVVH